MAEDPPEAPPISTLVHGAGSGGAGGPGGEAPPDDPPRRRQGRVGRRLREIYDSVQQEKIPEELQRYLDEHDRARKAAEASREQPKPPQPAITPQQQSFRRRLRQMMDDVLSESVPDVFLSDIQEDDLKRRREKKRSIAKARGPFYVAPPPGSRAGTAKHIVCANALQPQTGDFNALRLAAGRIEAGWRPK